MKITRKFEPETVKYFLNVYNRDICDIIKSKLNIWNAIKKRKEKESGKEGKGKEVQVQVNILTNA